jgi:hypothetical protein
LTVQDYKMNDQNNPYPAHQEILLLLPWYVNNTLHSAEVKTVENHLKVCLTCRREIESLYKLSVAARQVGPLDSVAHASFLQLKKRLHPNAKPDREPEAPVAPSCHRKWYSRYLTLPRSAFALAAVLLLSLLIPRYTDTVRIQGNEYHTLADKENPAAGENEIRVVFSNDVNQQQIKKILASVNGRIVAGPTTHGVYIVRIEQAPASKSILELIALLRKNASIIFAEPAYALLSSFHADKAIK